MKLKLLLICGLVAFHLSAQEEYPQNYFAPPLDGQLRVSGTFSELRSNHFHSGIDLKTGGVVGKPVLAAAEGYITRIKVSPYGYGKALYMRHPNGYTTVYAHLSRFDAEIESYVKQQQVKLQRHAVDLFPVAGKFAFEQGEEIAKSGNSGGSGAPHLHYEIRDASNDAIINPLHFGLDVNDRSYPVMEDLIVYNFQSGELQGSQQHRLLNNGNGQYLLAGSGLVTLRGQPAFGLSSYDRLSGTPNHNGIYDSKLYINDSLYYHFQGNRFTFSTTRYINSHIDYGQEVCCNRTFSRLYRQPNNNFPAYQQNHLAEKLNLPTDSTYAVKITAADFAGNTSVLQFKMKMEDYPEEDFPLDELKVFRYARENHYESETVSLDMTAGSLYDDIYFEHEVLDTLSDYHAPLHQISAAEIPVHKYYSLKIKTFEDIRTISPDKLGVVILGEENELKEYVGGRFKEGWIHCRVREFGKFTVAADTTAPQLKNYNFRPGQKIEVMDELQLFVEDEWSGIDRYEAYWNKQWLPIEYDYKNDLLHIKAADIFAKRGEHALKVTVWDEQGNSTTRRYQLIW